MTALETLYGDSWNARTDQFLQSSVYLEDPLNVKFSPGPEVQRLQQCFFKTLATVVQAGLNKKEISFSLIKSLSDKISAESEINEKKASCFIEKLSENIKEIKSQDRSVQVVSLLANVVFTLEKEKIFGCANRKITLLIMNYVASYFESPLIVFKFDERNEYLEGIDNVFKMRLLIAKKVRESVFFQGLLMNKIGGKYGTDRYQSTGPIVKEGRVEWNDLALAELEWKEGSCSIQPSLEK